MRTKVNPPKRYALLCCSTRKVAGQQNSFKVVGWLHYYLHYLDQNAEQFIYAYDICVTSQESTFEAVAANFTSVLDELLLYYDRNHLHANKTQACSFHLRNHEAN